MAIAFLCFTEVSHLCLAEVHHAEKWNRWQTYWLDQHYRPIYVPCESNHVIHRPPLKSWGKCHYAALCVLQCCRYTAPYSRSLLNNTTPNRLFPAGHGHTTAGATALLQGKVPIGLIKLVSHWRSDEVFRYLHTQSKPLMSPVANTMLAAAS